MSSTESTTPEAASTTLPQCMLETCPLNEVGMVHSIGIYKHNGQDQTGFDILFANCNPPDFIWDAWVRFGQLDRMIKKGSMNGQNVDALKKEQAENINLVDRFLDIHCSCQLCVEGGKH